MSEQSYAEQNNRPGGHWDTMKKDPMYVLDYYMDIMQEQVTYHIPGSALSYHPDAQETEHVPQEIEQSNELVNEVKQLRYQVIFLRQRLYSHIGIEEEKKVEVGETIQKKIDKYRESQVKEPLEGIDKVQSM